VPDGTVGEIDLANLREINIVENDYLELCEELKMKRIGS
jgi:hypothetical protein